MTNEVDQTDQCVKNSDGQELAKKWQAKLVTNYF